MVEQKDILLVTLNSSYHHTAFGLRYLLANLQDLRPNAKILESTIGQKTEVLLGQILQHKPKVVGFGVYIWNSEQTLAIIRKLKSSSPQTLIVLGGPEVSHESENQEICKAADYVIKGEADFLFYQFCQAYFSQNILPEHKYLSAPLPEINDIQLPYSLYSDEDIKNRVLYVEASRGCPFRCEYCLSSLDKLVRSFCLDDLLREIDILINRGARQFKFVDRTFNLSVSTGTKILHFFLDRIHLGLFLHFEMVPDRLPIELKELIVKFPPGSLQFEIGIQTLNPEVAKNVSRRNDLIKVKENFIFLTQQTGVHIHADLIVGLPGEDIQSFANGFDELASYGPHEIQVGILKRLKGTPIIRHDKIFLMRYSDKPPFQILSTKDMDSLVIDKMNKFSKFWDLYANSGRFKNFMKILTERAKSKGSLFWEFDNFCNFLNSRFSKTYGLSLLQLTEAAWIYLQNELKINADTSKTVLLEDYCYGATPRDIPSFLRSPGLISPHKTKKNTNTSIPKRQKAHIN